MSKVSFNSFFGFFHSREREREKIQWKSLNQQKLRNSQTHKFVFVFREKKTLRKFQHQYQRQHKNENNKTQKRCERIC